MTTRRQTIPPTSRADLAKGDPRVHFIRHSVNQGHIATYNEGLEWASADYLLLLSADDWLLPGALSRAAFVFDRHPDVVLTCGRAAVADSEDSCPPVASPAGSPKYQILGGQAFVEKACSQSATSPVWTPTAIVRTSAQKKVGGYRNHLPHTGDLEMWLRLACHGAVARIDAFQAMYRKHDANMHYSYLDTANLRHHLLAFDSAFDEYEATIQNPQTLRMRYREAIAAQAVRLAEAAFVAHEESRHRECLAFALQVFPAIRSNRAWYRMRLTQALGHKAVAFMAGTVRGAKGLFRRAKTIRPLHPTTI